MPTPYSIWAIGAAISCALMLHGETVRVNFYVGWRLAMASMCFHARWCHNAFGWSVAVVMGGVNVRANLPTRLRLVRLCLNLKDLESTALVCLWLRLPSIRSRAWWLWKKKHGFQTPTDTLLFVGWNPVPTFETVLRGALQWMEIGHRLSTCLWSTYVHPRGWKTNQEEYRVDKLLMSWIGIQATCPVFLRRRSFFTPTQLKALARPCA